MGWSYGWKSKKELITYLTKSWGEVEKHVTIAQHCAGNVLWYVVEATTPETGKVEKYICCALLQGGRDDWGYKGMTESMGPYYYSCPLEFLEMTPVTCEEWRVKVLAYWQGKKDVLAKSTTLKAGDRVELPEGWTVRNFTLIEKVKKTWTAYGPDGRRYRLPMKAIQAATITPA